MFFKLGDRRLMMLGKIDSDNFRLLPADCLAIIRGVYVEISRQDWFSRDEKIKQEFATYVIRSYQRGIVEPEELLKVCLETARYRHARPARYQHAPRSS
jgi:hypothetical protein